jgi:sugar phosphate isomerase/epimerase
MIDRRTFLQGLSATVAAGLILPGKLLASPIARTIGIQLYTIRDLVNSDFIGTLKALSKIGYSAIEAAGYQNRKFYGLNPGDYAIICKENGIQPLSTHSRVNLINADEVIADTAKAEMKYLVLPSVAKEKRQNADDYKKLADEFNIIGSKCKNAGIKFGYHNHAFEFEKIDNQIPFDILLERTDPELCFVQIDLYWMVYAGYDPFDYFEKYPGRFEVWHVKDMEAGEGRESTEIGTGKINFPELFRMKEKSGMKYFFVEQESFKIAPVESITISYNYLFKLLSGI